MITYAHGGPAGAPQNAVVRHVIKPAPRRDPLDAVWRELALLRNRVAQLEAEAAQRLVKRRLPRAVLEVDMQDRVRMRDIATAVAAENKVSLDDLLGDSRVHQFSWPRQMVMQLAHEAGFSGPQIGRFLNRDHTTVMHGIRAAKARREQAARNG